MTTPICHSDLSPRLSVDDIGYEYGYEYSLSSLSFDFHHHRTSPQKHEPMQTRRNTERNHRPILSGSGAPGAPASTSASASASLSLPSNTNTNTNPDHNPGTLVIREEDLRHLADSLGGVLEGADETLSGLESDRNLLPSAIVRRCRELADGLASLAEELEGQSREERERLAGAIRHDLLLCEQYHNSNSNSSSNSSSSSNNSNNSSSNSNSNNNYYFDQPPQQEQEHDQPRPSEIDAVTVADETDGVLRALSGASTLLRDVETAFREIGKEEAEEIADAALVMARLFLLSLQSIHSNLLENLTDSNSDHDHHHDSINDHDYDYDNDNYATSVIIEELSANEDGEAMQGEDKIDPQRQTKQQPQPQPQPQTQRRNGNRNRDRDRDRNRQDRRVRLLWPPLGPGVDAAMSWTKGEAEKRPMLAVALGLTMWPVAISTALVGTSAALIDGAVQDAYDRFRNGPWIASLEQGAAQAYQAGRLTVATGKLLGRQSLRVAARQIERRGGLAPIAGDLRDMAVDRITHPIDTLGKVWDGVHWGFGAVRDATDEFLSMRRERRREAMI